MLLPDAGGWLWEDKLKNNAYYIKTVVDTSRKLDMIVIFSKVRKGKQFTNN